MKNCHIILSTHNLMSPFFQTDNADMDGSKSYEYKWGIRALTTVRRSVILKNVAAMYDVEVSTKIVASSTLAHFFLC